MMTSQDRCPSLRQRRAPREVSPYQLVLTTPSSEFGVEVFNLSAEVENLSVGVLNLSAEVENLSAEVENLSVGVFNLSAGVENLSAEVENLSVGVFNLSAEVENLSVGVENLSVGVLNGCGIAPVGVVRRQLVREDLAGAPALHTVREK